MQNESGDPSAHAGQGAKLDASASRGKRLGAWLVPAAGVLGAVWIAHGAALDAIDESLLWYCVTALGIVLISGVVGFVLRVVAVNVLLRGDDLDGREGFGLAFLASGGAALLGFAGTWGLVTGTLAAASRSLEPWLASEVARQLDRSSGFAAPDATDTPEVGSDRAPTAGRTAVAVRRIEGKPTPANARGLVVTWAGEGRYTLDRSHAFLARDRRAEGGEDIRWIAFARHRGQAGSYEYSAVGIVPDSSTRTVSAERVDLRVIDVATGRRVAVATLDAIPPEQVRRENPSEYRVESARIAEAVEEALKARARAGLRGESH